MNDTKTTTEDPTEIEAVIACLGDDAAKLRDEGGWAAEECADNMDRAAELLATHHTGTAGSTTPKEQ